MGKSQKTSSLLKHNSSNKSEVKQSKIKNSEFKRISKRSRKFKKKKKKKTSKCTKMKDNAQLLQETKSEHKSKLNDKKPTNSFKLAPDVLRSEKHASSNWEKLSKVLNINTSTPPPALPYQINNIRPQTNCNPGNVCPISYSSTVPYASSVMPQLYWSGAVSQRNYFSVSVPQANYCTGPPSQRRCITAATSHQVGSVYNQFPVTPISQFVYVPPSRPVAIPSVVIPGPPQAIPAVANVQQQNMWKQQQPKAPPTSMKDKRSQQFKSNNENLCKGHVYRPELLTKVIAMDCEMVGVGRSGMDSNLARVSIVNSNGECVYDKFVRPTEKVTDYRTPISGVRPEDLTDAETLYTVQKEVSDIMTGRVLVGHALKNDFNVLYISHPRHMIRDTSKYTEFRRICGGRTPSLKKLAHNFLDMEIQTGEHSSVEDAQTAMQLYKMFKKDWEISRNKLHVKNAQKS